MNHILKTANKNHFENRMLTDLALKMREQFCDSSFLSSQKIVRFPFVWLWFSYRRISKDEARPLLMEMEKRGLIEIVPFNGIRIKVDHYGK